MSVGFAGFLKTALALGFRRSLGTITVARTAAQVVATGTSGATLDLATPILEEAGPVDITNNYIVIPAGTKKVRVSSRATFSVGAGTYRRLRIIVGTVQINQFGPATSGVACSLSASSDLIDLAAHSIEAGTATISVNVAHDAGSDLNISAAYLSVDCFA